MFYWATFHFIHVVRVCFVVKKSLQLRSSLQTSTGMVRTVQISARSNETGGFRYTDHTFDVHVVAVHYLDVGNRLLCPHICTMLELSAKKADGFTQRHPRRHATAARPIPSSRHVSRASFSSPVHFQRLYGSPSLNVGTTGATSSADI